ncbi:uncharacterized protein LOC130448412 [Diorhabda sublineata]|uniref:uncharacterized protein LOC130448412 n=1 Tax=Diorhabda sublineata TaxID=1163346 RepID=UPI0024E092BD|nr:uncharacterized protein LOC130448412 [Diorhabda sublineata]
MSIEHFKKRLIQKHQKPLLEAQTNSVREEVDEETSSNSSGSSTVSNDQKQEKNKHNTIQTKVARKRNVCRSKFRHNSLTIFKLGTSVPTSLCKSKEPYNVSTEKNLQLCCENKEAQSNNNNSNVVNYNVVSETSKTTNKEAITEQIINSIDTNKNIQRSQLYNNKLSGKHILPAIVPEISFINQNSSIRRYSIEETSRTETNTIRKLPLHQTAPIWNGTTQQPRLPIQRTCTERISPDSTSSTVVIPSNLPYNDTNPPPITNKCPYIPKSLPLNVSLPSNTTITPITHPNAYFSKTSDPQRYVESVLTKPSAEVTETPINLSVKENLLKLMDPHFYSKYQYILDNITQGIDELKLGLSLSSNRFSTSIQDYHKLLRITVAKAMLPLSRRLMRVPFNAEILAIFNYFYQYLTFVKVAVDVSIELKLFIDDLINEIISFLTKTIFNDSTINPTLRRYTIKILTHDLDSQIPLLKDVLPIIPEKYTDPNWMRHFLNALKRNVPNTKPKPPTKRKLNHLQSNSKRSTNRNKSVLPTDNYTPETSNILSVSDSYSVNILDKPTVIVQDESMEVTVTDKDTLVDKRDNTKEIPPSEMDIKKEWFKCENGVTEDLNLFKELLRNEDKEVYKKVLEKLVGLKQTTLSHEIITIDDEEEDTSKEDTSIVKSEIKDNSFIEKRSPSDVVIIEVDEENHSIGNNASDSNQNYIKNIKIPCGTQTPQEVETSNSSSKILKTCSVQSEINLPKTNNNKIINLVSPTHYNGIKNIETVSSKSYPEKTNKQTPLIETIESNTTKTSMNTGNLSALKPEVEDISSDEEDRKPFVKTIGYDCTISDPERFFENSNIHICKLVSTSEPCIKPDPIPKYIYTMPVGPLTPLQTEKKKNIIELSEFNETKKSLTCRLKINNEPKVCTPRLYSVDSPNQSNTPESISPSDLVTEHLGTSGANWKNWITEERNKSFLTQRRLSERRQSIETISSVGSDYSPSVDHEENYVKIRIEKKWYRINKSVMECIPKGKMTYDREKNHLVRYFDDAQIEQFIKNVNLDLVAASDFFKKMRERVGGYLCDNIFLTPFEVPENNEVIQLSNDISFAKDDNISDPELYVEEVEKVERFVPKDFFGFYKYVTGYQIIHNHDPISFQMFLTMHNTNRIKSFYRRYLLSILENKYV